MFFWQNKDDSFKGLFTFEQRKKMTSEALERYPDRLPLICEQSKKSRLPEVQNPRIKYLVKPQMKMYRFIHDLRSKMSLDQSEAIYVFAKEGKRVQFLKSDTTLGEVYANYKDEDGFLYLEYRESEFTG